MPDDELDHHIRDLHSQIQGIGTKLERDLHYLSSLVAAFHGAPPSEPLHALHDVGGSCIKLGQRLTELGENLRATTWETMGQELLRPRWELREPL
jgi:hypothetical protein